MTERVNDIYLDMWRW